MTATEAKANKKSESITALKNAHKHLEDLFKDLAKKDQTLKTCSDDLQRVANQCGDIKVMVWVGPLQQATFLKIYLGAIAASLNEAR